MKRISDEGKRNLEIIGVIIGILAGLTTIAFNLNRILKELKADAAQEKAILNAEKGELPESVEFLGFKF